MGGIHWPTPETQAWMAFAGATALLAHWLYYSVWLRLPEWRLVLRELRGHRAGFADHAEIASSRSWVDEGKLEKSGPLVSLQLAIFAALMVWVWRDVPHESGRWVQEALTLGMAVLAFLAAFRRDVEEVGAPPAEVKEPEGVFESLLGPVGAKAVHVAIAALMFAAAYWLVF